MEDAGDGERNTAVGILLIRFFVDTQCSHGYNSEKFSHGYKIKAKQKREASADVGSKVLYESAI